MKPFAPRTLATVLLNCAALVWCAWQARDVVPPDASWWPGALMAATVAAFLAVGCVILLLARGVSWLMGHPAPPAGRPGDS